MAQNQTLQNFVTISQSLKHIKIDCHNLVRTVRRVTASTIVFEHHGTANPPASKDIRKVLNTDPNPHFHVLIHSSRRFSVLMLKDSADMNKIITHASQFAPQYTLRRIQQEEESPPKPTFSASPKVSEIAELQCYLKAYFHQMCDERVEEKARRQRLKEEKKANTREFPGWQKPGTSKKKHKEAGEGGGLHKATQHPPATGSGHSNSIPQPSTIFVPRPLLRHRLPTKPTSPPPTTAGRRRKRSESPQPNAAPPLPGAHSSNRVNNESSSQPQPTISGHAARQMAIEIYQEVVDAAMSGVPLMLELLGGSADDHAGPAASSSRVSGNGIVRGLAYLDAGMAAQLESAIRLRRLIVDPVESRLALYDLQVRAAVERAHERLRKAREEEN